MSAKEKEVEYNFNEDRTLKDLKWYIDQTYNSHYSKNKYQSTEFIIDGGHGEGFCIGNILKYAQRYGRKADDPRKDLMKILHYAIIMLHIHEQESENVSS